VCQGATPQQAGLITKNHREVSGADWAKPQVKSKTNCPAYHNDADAGTFEVGAMHIPKN